MEENRKEQIPNRSFRVSDDVLEKFNGLRKELDLTQDGALAALIKVYEMEQAKNALPDRETEITNFRNKATELVEAFLHSLQLNADAEARIRSEVALQLETKDKSIADYQKQKEKLTSDLEEVKERAEQYYGQYSMKLQEVIGERQRADQAEAAVKDKDSIISMLTEKLADAEERAEGYEDLNAQKEKLQEELKDARDAMKENEREHNLQMERASRDAEKTKEQAVQAIKDEMQATINDLQSQLQQVQIDAEHQLREVQNASATELREVQRTAAEELRMAQNVAATELREAEKAYNAEIAELKEKNAQLREQLAEARAMIPKTED